MRQLYSRWQDRDDTPGGPDLLPHEGTPLGPEADEGPWLRPLADQIDAVSPAGGGPGGDRGLDRALEQERLGRRLDAIATLQQLLSEQPGHQGARIRLAHLLEVTGEPDAATSLLAAGLGLEPDAANLLEAKGMLLARLARHAEAEADLRRALALDPVRPGATLVLGVTLLRRGRLAEALPLLERAVELAPSEAIARFHLGEARYQAGDMAGALDQLRLAGSLAPDDARPFALAGRLLDRLGRAEEAMEMHRQARLAGRK